MIDLTDDTIRAAWKWLPDGVHCASLYIDYENVEVTDEHRMAALVGVQWFIQWGNECCRDHPENKYGHDVYTRHECPLCWDAFREFMAENKRRAI